jgi:hypothetical protein
MLTTGLVAEIPEDSKASGGGHGTGMEGMAKERLSAFNYQHTWPA